MMQTTLHGVGLVDLLESDPRPSFVVTLPSTGETPDAQATADVVYTNPALSSFALVLDVLKAPKERHARFWEWIASQPALGTPGGTSLSTCFSYLDVTWTRSIVMQRWAVVGANEPPSSAEPPRRVRLESQEGSFVAGGGSTPAPACAVGVGANPVPALPLRESPKRRVVQMEPAAAREVASRPVNLFRRAVTDPGWILPEFMPEQQPFLDVINSVDWAATPLGPMQTWPPRLRQTFSSIIADSRPIAIYWDDSYTTVYNEAFSRLCGSRHPGLLGKPVEAAWPGVGRAAVEADDADERAEAARQHRGRGEPLPGEGRRHA